jgi:hypothetical protein
MKELDKIIANNVNPYTIVRIVSLNTEEELNEIQNNITDEEVLDLKTNDIVEIEISLFESILFITRNDLIDLTKKLINIGYIFKVTNIVNKIFEMDNLDDLLSSLEIDEDPEFTAKFFPGLVFPKQKAINIINLVFESNFSVDDVLDRINTKGSGSLNEFHKNLLK